MTSAKQPVYRVSYGGPAVAGMDSDHWLSDEFSGYEADKLRPSAPPLQNPVSLLTTLLHSSEYRSDQHLATTNPPSTHTSAPPTATSTPVPPAPDLRSLPTASILRRGSMSASSDTDYVGLGLGVAGFEGLAGRLGRLDEKRERSETSERAGVSLSLIHRVCLTPLDRSSATDVLCTASRSQVCCCTDSSANSH